jgi:hypothetical protein
MLEERSKEELLKLLVRERRARIFVESAYVRLLTQYESMCSQPDTSGQDFIRNQYLNTYSQRMESL